MGNPVQTEQPIISAAMTTPWMVIDDFLPLQLAEAMRACIDEHFAAPQRHKPETHQVWNYWHVPGIYTYLRTMPDKIFPPELAQQFFAALHKWAVRSLGLSHVSWPYLSLYINGCHQGVHNDSLNGRIGFVYSLTRDDRKTGGGQTLVMREGNPVLDNLRNPANSLHFFDWIEPKFNRLTLFDDRMPHAVERVAGPMDPYEGRLVLHGHISEGPPIVEGALPPESAMNPLWECLNAFTAKHPDALERFHGPLCLRVDIDAAGKVAEIRTLTDRVLPHAPEDQGFAAMRGDLIGRFQSACFAEAAGPTSITIPVLLGGLLPFLQPKSLSPSPDQN